MPSLSLTVDPRKVRIVERARAENERPIVTVAKHRTVTLLPTSLFVLRESVPAIDGEELTVNGQELYDVGIMYRFRLWSRYVEPTVPVTEPVGTEIPKPKRSKKKRVTRESKRMPTASHPPKRLRADYGTTGGSATEVIPVCFHNRLLQDSRLTVEQGVPALPTLPFITSSVTASPLEEGGDRTDSVTGPSLRTIGPSARFVVLSDSSHHSGAKSADPEVDSLVMSAALVMTEATTRCHSARNLSLSSEVRMRAEYNILEKRKWRSLTEEKDILLKAKDKEIEDLKSQLLKANEESAEVAQLRAQVSGLEATENSLRGEVASTKDHNVLLEQECNSLKLKVMGLEFTIAEKDRIVHELEISSTDLREKLEMYEGSLKQLEEFQDNLMGPHSDRLAEIEA
ncbi:hypothetical protein Tco_0894990 [Tanacetum coccineum]|uniref:Uncharacterized protein n=1 Tax=Tanacetum coccineum TaxID=301880 RepID=A0ABQ5CFY2_9ASTR